ncbi:NUDIX domain-containing protein [Levilactobacillus namurensis]|uniref:NUDIX domain-containing protein n=1 Tax=Levilactobacillus namurensis TaxID=380393 RepID=A0AAW8W6G3_9LACO|nr:NUDIX domain-containing protein [Levilactobacillus namurensis]MDT7014445.1 NUDIX domain-containing protein [Levilactobacillus namurensis]
MGYVTNLRKTVGSQPLVVIGAAAVVLRQNQLLLVDRRDNHLWGLPAGSKELNESLETTAIRELHEETGLLGQRPELLTIVSGPGCQYQYPNGDQIDSSTAVYRLQATGTPGGSNETRMSCFFDLSALPARMTPITQEILRRLTRNHQLVGDD